MQHRVKQRFLASVVAFCLSLCVWAIAPSAYAYDNPDLLPGFQTPVIDLADSLTTIQHDTLVKDIEQFEAETGWKLRVLTQFDRTPGYAVKEYWGLDDKSILLVADARGGNILNFNVGDDVYELMPRTFWIELQTRFGNLFFVRENGEDQAIVQSIESIKGCLVKGGCRVVPGLPQEQWILTLITSLVGGFVCGFAAQPRKEGQIIAWQWALMFAPLWGILFIAFGIGPVVSRTSDFLPLLRNITAFLMGALVAYLSPAIARSSTSETNL